VVVVIQHIQGGCVVTYIALTSCERVQIRPMPSASYRSVVKHRLYLYDKTGITAGSSYIFPVEVHERVNDDGKSDAHNNAIFLNHNSCDYIAVDVNK
jgi:hypothetical protein